MTGAQAVVTRPSTIAVRLHGRGGQGIVTAAELLAVAAFLEGQETQAFPSFGSERMGAPVTSYCRVSATPIRSREPVSEPDAVLIVDATLLHQVDVFAGLRDDGWVVINSVHAPDGLGIDDLAQRLKPDRLICIPATDIARTYLGRPVPNLCVLAAFAACTATVSLESLEEAIRERFPTEVADANIRAARAAAAHLAEVSRA